MRVVDSGVDHADLHVLAEDARRTAPHGRRADERHAHRVFDLIRQNGLHRDDAWKLRERGNLRWCPADLDPVDGVLQGAHDAHALRANQRNERVLPQAERPGNLVLLRMRQASAGPAAAHDGDGVIGEFEDDGRVAGGRLRRLQPNRAGGEITVDGGLGLHAHGAGGKT